MLDFKSLAPTVNTLELQDVFIMQECQVSHKGYLSRLTTTMDKQQTVQDLDDNISGLYLDTITKLILPVLLTVLPFKKPWLGEF
ncbi:hypothetical protein ACHWQZ_G006800 [Mnemiopsis leidyi]